MIPLIMKKTKKNSIDGVNLPDSRLVELLDRCAISVKDVRTDIKKNSVSAILVSISEVPTFSWVTLVAIAHCLV